MEEPRAAKMALDAQAKLMRMANADAAIAPLPASAPAAEPSPSLSPLPRVCGMSLCRPGIFVVAPKELQLAQRVRFERYCVAVRLLPYADVQMTPLAHGPPFRWTVDMRAAHDDTQRAGLLVHLGIFLDPMLGMRQLVGTAMVTLDDVVAAPGASLDRWVAIEPRHQGAPSPGQLLVSLCFHPKVTGGPTLQRLLQNIQSEPRDATAIGSLRRRKWFDVFSQRRNELTVKAALQQPNLPRVKGTFSFQLAGIHLCSAQCSRIDGHSSLSYPEFAPIVVVRFGDFENDVRLRATECETAVAKFDWFVCSSFSTVDVDIMRKASFVATATKKLADGTPVTKVAGLSISCHQLQEQQAAAWTFDPIPDTLGPGRKSPREGFNWYPLIADGEEVGLAQISASYTENFVALFEPEESLDLSFVYPEERSFDASIILRNVERLDELFLLVKAASAYVDELLEWKSPVATIFVWASISFTCWFVSFSYAPVFVMGLLLVVMSFTLVSFLKGNTHKKWISRVPGSLKSRVFRAVATLRVVPLRASDLRSVDGSIHPDTFVRIFYEPNYKTVPVHLIAQTQCSRRNRNPQWAIAQPDGNPNDDEFVKTNNRKLRDLIKHLSPSSQDAVLLDVVEAWARRDGTVDTHAFKYPILQPVEKPPGGEENVVDWGNAPGTVRFDVMQDNIEGPSALIGRVRIPINQLISNEARGGPQRELEQTIPLITPSKSGSEVNESVSTITVRMELTLREARSRVSLKEMLASEALYEVLEMEAEEELTWVQKYHRAKDVATNIQQTLGQICSTLERVKNLVLWVHPTKTLLVFVATAVLCVCLAFIPLRFIMLYSIAKRFTKKFHKMVDKDIIRLRNFLITIPSDLDMKKIYHLRNQAFLREKAHADAQAKLQAAWTGVVWKQSDNLNIWHERYCAVRGGRIEFWQSMSDAKSGLSPTSFMTVSCAVDTCHKLESANTPKDTFPLVVIDVSRRSLLLYPRGRRRVLCTKSEEEFRGIVSAVQATGEMDLQTRPSSST